ncbi:MAG: ABC transporter permease, partial [Lentisphaeraceae bacterium]|nr:ABC transporter permease [Lentisphaeraceae bacterium]
FIMGGAAIGVAACLFSLVIQKTKEIGILKATGASPLSIILVFLSQGTFIGFFGSVLGFVGGYIALEYRETIAHTLGAWDPELYKLKNIPKHIDWNGDVPLILIGSLIICVVAALVPAIVAACVNPVKALQSGS